MYVYTLFYLFSFICVALNFSKNNWHIEGGGRYNHHSEYGSNGAFNFNPSYILNQRLKFFGNISQQQVLKASQAAARAVEGLRSLTIHIEGAGSFPPRGPAKVLWIGISDPTGTLIQLQQKFDSECEREGFPKEVRAFHPHLTVARLRTARGARALADRHKQLEFEGGDVYVSSLILFRSELSSKGSTYTRISTHGLG